MSAATQPRFAQPAGALEADPQHLARLARVIHGDEPGQVVPGAQVDPAEAAPFGQVDRATEQRDSLDHPAETGQGRGLRDQGVGDHLGVVRPPGVGEAQIRGDQGGGRLVMERLGPGELAVELAELPISDPLAELVDRRGQELDRRLDVGPVDEEPAMPGLGGCEH